MTLYIVKRRVSHVPKFKMDYLFDEEEEARAFIEELIEEYAKINPDSFFEHKTDPNDFHEEWHGQNIYTKEIMILEKQEDED